MELEAACGASLGLRLPYLGKSEAFELTHLTSSTPTFRFQLPGEKPRILVDGRNGFIVKENCAYPSNWRSEATLDGYLKKNKVVGIEGIDTRRLTRHSTIAAPSALANRLTRFWKGETLGFKEFMRYLH